VSKTNNGPRMKRARQMARANTLWSAIFTWLGQRKIRDLMVQASDQQKQALAAVVTLLHAQFGADLDDRSARVFVGVAVAGVMEEEGFDVLSKGDRMPANPVGFRTAARYVRLPVAAPAQAEAEDGADEDILLTMLAALSVRQRRLLVKMIG